MNKYTTEDYQHTLVIAGNGTVYSFGGGEWGQLGHGGSENKLTPTLIKAPS